MTSRVAGVVELLLVGVLMMGSTAHAQLSEHIVRANIPFDFAVGDQNFPPGRYSVALIGPVFLELRDADGRILTQALTHAVVEPDGNAQPKLRFESQGGRRVLTQVWQAGDLTGQEILQPKSASLAVRKRSRRVQTAEAGNPR